MQVTYATTMGQNLDMLTAPDGVDNFDAYNMARYCQIVKFKVCGKNLFWLLLASARSDVRR